MKRTVPFNMTADFHVSLQEIKCQWIKDIIAMAPSKLKKTAVWRILVGVCALMSGVMMTISVGLIPSWFLYKQPASLSFLLKYSVISTVVLLLSIKLLTDKPTVIIKDLLPKFVVFVSFINTARIGSSIIRNSFTFKYTELSLFLISAAMIYLALVSERNKMKMKRHKAANKSLEIGR
jgi:hypothetical protein